MRLLPRSRKGSSRAAKARSAALMDRRDGHPVDDRSVDAEKLMESWNYTIDREQVPQHCLSFLTNKTSKRKSLLDEDSTMSKPWAAVKTTSARIDEDQNEATEVVIQYESRDQPPMTETDMKEQVMHVISKAQYPLGKLNWKKAEELLKFWTKQGSEESVHLSIILLDRVVEEHEKAPKWSESQLLFWLKAVIQNWNKGQRENNFSTFAPKDMVEQVEAWYHCIDLNPEIYSMIIDGAAYSHPYVADSLLRRTIASQHKGLIYSNTYNQVLRAWVDAGDPYQAEALLDLMLSEWRNRRESAVNIAAKPNRQSFHWVLLGWANSNESVAAERTEHILENMEMYSKTGTLSSIKPNASTYKWVLDSLVKAPNRTPEANAQRAEKVVEVLQEKADNGEEDFRPTVEMYSVVVAAWGNAGDPDKGEDLLHQLYRDYQGRDHDKRLQPNLEIFNNLLLGWSKVPSKLQRKKAGERAEAILEHMEKLANTNVLPGVKPDLQSYNTLLDCWSRCGDGKRAQDLLERMIQRWESGDDIVAPDTTSYSHVLTAWNRAGNHERCVHIIDVLHKQFMELNNYRVHPNLILAGLAEFGSHPAATRKAKQLFQKMEDLHLSGTRKDIKPNVATYSHILECLCKCQTSQAGTQAEHILNEMLAKYSAGEEELKPTVKIYNQVMKALVKTKEPKRTEEVLAIMYDEDIRGARVYPDLETFNTILLAWTKSGLGDVASKRAEQILRRLERIHESRILQNVKPNIVSYNLVLECLVQRPHEPDAGERADEILERMEDKGVDPNTITYNRVILALKNSGDIKRANQLLRKLKRKSFQDDDELSLMETASIQWF